MGFVSHDPAIAMGIVIPLCVLGSAIYPLRLALGRLAGKA
jgi:hypothetical protein